jgi:hypothetical protein
MEDSLFTVMQYISMLVSSCSQYMLCVMSRDSSVGIATGYRLNDQMIGVRFSAGTGNFSLLHRVQTGSRAHPASYPMGTGAFSLSFP